MKKKKKKLFIKLRFQLTGNKRGERLHVSHDDLLKKLVVMSSLKVHKVFAEISLN